MKNIFFFHFILLIPSFSSIFIKPVFSDNTILNCSGDIPKNNPCLIKATTYKVNILKIDLCQTNPFPSFRSSPDYIGAKCLNLFDKKKSRSFDLKNNQKLNLPRNVPIAGKYKYISMIFENKFSASGKYYDGNFSWKTSRKGPKNIIKEKNNFGKAYEFTTKLQNWRGKENTNNKYCSNNGGTKSRCELKYNGFKLTGIGLGSDFIEEYGKGAKYMFYMSELVPEIILDKNSSGSIELNYQKNLEVYGDGGSVKSISIAPFIIKAIYLN
tara:strand:- start:295 stop:1101 length:807 start_codon:yes stop_codon:yes gene_type:complete